MATAEERLARNQALFREVNERIQDFGGAGAVEFFCECSSLACLETFPLRIDQYERVRSNPLWFAIVPGHEVPSLERVVSEDPHFIVVEKLVAPRPVIENTRVPRPDADSV